MATCMDTLCGMCQHCCNCSTALCHVLCLALVGNMHVIRAVYIASWCCAGCTFLQHNTRCVTTTVMPGMYHLELARVLLTIVVTCQHHAGVQEVPCRQKHKEQRAHNTTPGACAGVGWYNDELCSGHPQSTLKPAVPAVSLLAVCAPSQHSAGTGCMGLTLLIVLLLRCADAQAIQR